MAYRRAGRQQVGPFSPDPRSAATAKGILRGMDSGECAAAQSQEATITAGKLMRLAVALFSVALLLGTSASGAGTAVQFQYPRPRVVPSLPRPQPAPVVRLPFPACDRIPQPPRYPPLALAMDEQGDVTLMIYVEATGRIREAQVHQSSGSVRLDEAAVASTRTWTLEPGRQDTRPTAMWAEAIVSFRILAGEPGSGRVEIRFTKAADIARCLA